MDLLEYVESYNNCAANHIPKEAFCNIMEKYADKISGLSQKVCSADPNRRSRTSLRFRYGTCVGWGGGPYTLAYWPELDMVIEWSPDLLEEQEDLSIDIGDLL